MKKVVVVLACLILMSFVSDGFKAEQKRYPRVRKAYEEKGASVNQILEATSIKVDELEIYIRVFKHSKELELWGKAKKDSTFKILKIYDICKTCGLLGPKRQQGDMQIPEGFYHIDAFNPASNFHLSMRVNYPNKSDRILGVKGKLGGNICIHGACVTIGCMPITDAQIQELYLFCIEAKNNGQVKIPVSIFPARLGDNNMNVLKDKYASDKSKLDLWEDLKQAYDKFNESKKLPSIQFLVNGRHMVL
ncbi:L,D-transpeptidase family protein [Labilibacter marinus]|uniref:L,D-transpeptidase family protein n=1 Tax=Labilibacter marinus TaxID=1477105 RepID=UPI0009502202|nr:hypothetical protein [Labilibacter marinus]